MDICEHVKDEFPLRFAKDNKVFLILILILTPLLPKPDIWGQSNITDRIQKAETSSRTIRLFIWTSLFGGKPKT